MKAIIRTLTFGSALTLLCAVAAGSPAQAQQDEPVYELRIYRATPGNLDALVARFRDHTVSIFDRHGMTNIGYWVPTDEEGSADTLIYILSHPSEEAALASWRAFASDPEWQQVNQETTRNGPIVQSVERRFMTATDFSGLH